MISGAGGEVPIMGAGGSYISYRPMVLNRRPICGPQCVIPSLCVLVGSARQGGVGSGSFQNDKRFFVFFVFL